MTHPFVKQARGWIGTPYMHQASLKGVGCDCLGLLRGVWREVFGEEPEAIPAYTPDWSEPQHEERLFDAALRHMQLVQSSEFIAGQVILFRMRDTAVAKHIGLASQSDPLGHFIHAYSGHGVVESPLTAAWRRRIAARFEIREG